VIPCNRLAKQVRNNRLKNLAWECSKDFKQRLFKVISCPPQAYCIEILMPLQKSFNSILLPLGGGRARHRKLNGRGARGE
jgi:hypothetical protein